MVSKQVGLVFLGVAAAAIAAVVLVIQPFGRESGDAEPPIELATEAAAKRDGQSFRGDRVTPTALPEPAAQAALPGQAPQAAPPQRRGSRKDFADWVLMCPQEGSGRGCLVGQNHMQAKTERSIFAIQLRRSDDGGVQALLTTPLHVRLRPGIVFDVGQGEPIKFEFSQCRPEQCRADARFGDEVINRLLTAQRAKATFEVANGQTAAIDISLNGFTEAFAAFQRMN